MIYLSAPSERTERRRYCFRSMCVCVRARSGPVNNSSNTVKATDFKFDKHVPRDSPDMTPWKFFEKRRGQNHVIPQNVNAFKLLFCKHSLCGDMHSQERLLVLERQWKYPGGTNQWEIGYLLTSLLAGQTVKLCSVHSRLHDRYQALFDMQIVKIRHHITVSHANNKTAN